jgi:hypothetical protein
MVRVRALPDVADGDNVRLLRQGAIQAQLGALPPRPSAALTLSELIRKAQNFHMFHTFLCHAREGVLPNYSFIEPRYNSDIRGGSICPTIIRHMSFALATSSSPPCTMHCEAM